MAIRADIRDVFYDELVSVATQSRTVTYGDGSTTSITVDESNIQLLSPNRVEERPAIIYDDNHTRRLYNGVGTGPHKTVRDNSGDVQKEVWREYLTSTFQVRVEADSEILKEPLYEAIRSHFAKYNLGGWDERDLHPDISDVRVDDGTSTDYTQEENAIRVDDITVMFDWHREYDFTDDTIDTVDLNADGTDYTI